MWQPLATITTRLHLKTQHGQIFANICKVSDNNLHIWVNCIMFCSAIQPVSIHSAVHKLQSRPIITLHLTFMSASDFHDNQSFYCHYCCKLESEDYFKHLNIEPLSQYGNKVLVF